MTVKKQRIYDRRARLALKSVAQAQAELQRAYEHRAMDAASAWDEGCSMREIACALDLSLSATHKIIHAGRALR